MCVRGIFPMACEISAKTQKHGKLRVMIARAIQGTLLGLVLCACGDDGTPSAGSTSGTDSTGSTTSQTSTQTTAPQTTSTGPSTTAPSTTATTSSTTSGSSSTTSNEDGSTSTGAVDRVPKSLVIAIDGLRPDALASANTPNLDALRDGSWADGYAGTSTAEAQALDDAATLSGPNHWAIMTGATGEQHGVTGNGDVAAGDADAFPHYLSLLERDDPTRDTAYLYTWGPDGLIPSESDYVRDGDDETNTDRAASILAGDFEDAAGDFDSSWAMTQDVDALFLFLDDVDGAGHGSGFSPDVPQYVAAIELADAQVGELLEALVGRASFGMEAWQIVVTTDHGGIGTNHGGTTPEERTIPFLLSSRDVTAGALPEGTRNIDVVPSVLEHFMVSIPRVLTGIPRGS